MEDARQILLQALVQAGVPLPAEAQSAHGPLTPSSLVSISIAYLSLIHGFQPPPGLPRPFSESSVSERFRLCSVLASAIKGLGYSGDLTFQQFLYPSEEETHKLLRFMLDSIAKFSDDRHEARKRRGNTDSNDDFDASEATTHGLIPSALHLKLGDLLQTLTFKGDLLETASIEEKEDFAGSSTLAVEDSVEVSLKEEGLSNDGAIRTSSCSIIGVNNAALLPEKNNVVLTQKQILQEIENEEQEASVITSSGAHMESKLSRLEERLNSISLENVKLTKEVADLEKNLVDLEAEVEASSKDLVLLERDYSVLETAANIVLDPSTDKGSKMKELIDSIEDVRVELGNLKTNWEITFKELQIKKDLLEVLSSNRREEIQMKLKLMKETRDKIEELTIMSKHREAQLVSLSTELEHSAKGSSRSSYIKRITELIKNSKKLDIDTSQIIEEIRGLQRESNANQGRLKRTYALVDELVFRYAKREPLGRQSYRLLTSLHENFSECYDKIFSIDRIQREISELQETVESLEQRPVDLKKLQADIDSIVAENISLGGKRFHESER